MTGIKGLESLRPSRTLLDLPETDLGLAPVSYTFLSQKHWALLACRQWRMEGRDHRHGALALSRLASLGSRTRVLLYLRGHSKGTGKGMGKESEKRKNINRTPN